MTVRLVSFDTEFSRPEKRSDREERELLDRDSPDAAECRFVRT